MRFRVFSIYIIIKQCFVCPVRCIDHFPYYLLLMLANCIRVISSISFATVTSGSNTFADVLIFRKKKGRKERISGFSW